MKIACCSTLNDQYFDGFITFFYSLQKHNPWFNGPYYIFSWGDLSETNIVKLKTIYDNFIIKHIDNLHYSHCQYTNEFREWNINCNNRFEIFTLEEYDKIIFFDVDMLCLGDIKEIFESNVSFGACTIKESSEIDHPSKYNKMLKSFDGGLMVISKQYLTVNVRNELIDISLQKKWSSDEPILNTYFDNSKVTFLPKKYNTLTSEITELLLQEAKLIQFIGDKKPWFSGGLSEKYCPYVLQSIGLILTLKIDNIYKKYFNNAKKQYNISDRTAR